MNSKTEVQLLKKVQVWPFQIMKRLKFEFFFFFSSKRKTIQFAEEIVKVIAKANETNICRHESFSLRHDLNHTNPANKLHASSCVETKLTSFYSFAIVRFITESCSRTTLAKFRARKTKEKENSNMADTTKLREEQNRFQLEKN